MDPTSVVIVPCTVTDDGPTRLKATVNGSSFEVFGYGMEQTDDGRAMVSLIVLADAVQIGERPAGPVVPPWSVQDEAAKVAASVLDPSGKSEKSGRRGVWGQPGTPDPRENIPGWTSEPGQ